MSNKIRNVVVSVLGGVVLISGIGACSTATEEPTKKESQSAQKDSAKEQWEKEFEEAKKHNEKGYKDLQKKDSAPEGTVSQQQAVEAAQSYLDMGGFSKAGLIEQLSSEYGDGFSKSDAEYAANHVNVNWNEQAVQAAEGYMEMGGFSRASLLDQLTSEYGDQFTQTQAEYAVNQVGL